MPHAVANSLQDDHDAFFCVSGSACGDHHPSGSRGTGWRRTLIRRAIRLALGIDPPRHHLSCSQVPATPAGGCWVVSPLWPGVADDPVQRQAASGREVTNVGLLTTGTAGRRVGSRPPSWCPSGISGSTSSWPPRPRSGSTADLSAPRWFPTCHPRMTAVPTIDANGTSKMSKSAVTDAGLGFRRRSGMSAKKTACRADI